MASLADVFSEKERTNWLKSWLAIEITKSGLQHFVNTEVQHFHAGIYNSILSKLQAPAMCVGCNTSNLLKCPTPGVCKKIGKYCPMHGTIETHTRQCRINVCGKVKNEIEKKHRYGRPSWKCTSAKRWASNPWEIAKSYFPPDGYDSRSSIQETDFNGIISFLLNCTHFDGMFSFTITTSPDPRCCLTKVRNICNAVRHSPQCKVTDDDLQEYFTTLTDLLSDSTSLAQDIYAQDAVRKLSQLQNDTLSYTEECKALQQQMKQYYSTHFGHTALSVLMPFQDKPLMDIYVPPKIQKLDDTGKKQFVYTYKDILMKDVHNRTIFLKGEAGTGKTTFAAKVVLDWCSYFSNSEPTSKCRTHFNDKETLHEYELVFLVSLRDTPTQIKVLQMIKEQIIDNIYGDRDQDRMFAILQIAMQKEPCLLIQDGLDEWSNSDEKHSQPCLPTCYENCTVLITTRPWKLEHSIKNSGYGSIFEIRGVNQPDMLANNILENYKRENNQYVSCSEFKKYIDTNQLEQFLEVPMILTLIVCLWVDGIRLKGTVCQIYSTLLESLLAKINKNTEDFHDSPVFCLKETRYIKPNIKYVKAIAKVAFNSLFSFNRENSLVFNEMDFYQHLEHPADKEEIKCFALKAGILSQRRSSSFINRSSTLSFVHKSFQEFFAAYYIADNINVIHGELSKYLTRCENGHLQVCELFRFLCGLNIDAANQLSWILYDHVASLNTNQVHFCESRSFQKILISGYKEAKANSHDKSNIRLKLSHIYFDFSIPCKTDMDILTLILKANIPYLRFWYIFGVPYYFPRFSIERQYNNVQSNEIMYNEHDGQYELFDLSPCTHLERIHLFGQVTLLPTALCNLHNLVQITIKDYVQVKGRLAVSANHGLETVDNGLDLSLCNNLQELELGEQITLVPCALRGRLKHVNIQGKCSGLDLKYCHDLESIELGINIILIEGPLPHRVKSIKLYCQCVGLDIQACHDLKTITLGFRITLIPCPLPALPGRVKNIDLDCKCTRLDLSKCNYIESIVLGNEITLLPGPLPGEVKNINLQCKCTGLSILKWDQLQSIKLGHDITLIERRLPVHLKIIDLQCKFTGLDISECNYIESIDLGDGITLLPGPLPGGVKKINLQCKCTRLDLSKCNNIESIVLGNEITLLPGPLPGGVNNINLQCKCTGLSILKCDQLQSIKLGHDITLIERRLPVHLKTIDLQCKCTGLDISECNYIKSIDLGDGITLLPGPLPGGVKKINLQCKCTKLDLSKCNYIESIVLGNEITLLPGPLPGGVNNINLQCKCTKLDLSKCNYIESIVLGNEITLLPPSLWWSK